MGGRRERAAARLIPALPSRVPTFAPLRSRQHPKTNHAALGIHDCPGPGAPDETTHGEGFDEPSVPSSPCHHPKTLKP